MTRNRACEIQTLQHEVLNTGSIWVFFMDEFERYMYVLFQVRLIRVASIREWAFITENTVSNLQYKSYVQVHTL